MLCDCQGLVIIYSYSIVQLVGIGNLSNLTRILPSRRNGHYLKAHWEPILAILSHEKRHMAMPIKGFGIQN